MDRRIEELLEDYLRGSLSPQRKADFLRALESADQETRQLIAQFEGHSKLIRGVFCAPEVEPAPGFYARVMDRIDTERTPSLWAAFLEPHFFKRLAFATATLLMLLSVTMFTADQQSTATNTVPPVLVQVPDTIRPASDPVVHSSNRDSVLVKLATYQE